MGGFAQPIIPLAPRSNSYRLAIGVTKMIRPEVLADYAGAGEKGMALANELGARYVTRRQLLAIPEGLHPLALVPPDGLLGRTLIVPDAVDHLSKLLRSTVSIRATRSRGTRLVRRSFRSPIA